MSVSPRKVRSVTRLLKGLSAEKALQLLSHLPKGACQPVAKVLKSAVANATRLGNVTAEELVVSKILADEGPGARRFRAVPMGRAMMYRRKMCHLTIELDVRKNGA